MKNRAVFKSDFWGLSAIFTSNAENLSRQKFDAMPSAPLQKPGPELPATNSAIAAGKHRFNINNMKLLNTGILSLYIVWYIK